MPTIGLLGTRITASGRTGKGMAWVWNSGDDGPTSRHSPFFDFFCGIRTFFSAEESGRRVRRDGTGCGTRPPLKPAIRVLGPAVTTTATVRRSMWTAVSRSIYLFVLLIILYIIFSFYFRVCGDDCGPRFRKVSS